MIAAFRPTPANRRRRHLVAIDAFDGVVLGDLSVPCEIFGRALQSDCHPFYEVRVCSLKPQVKSEHVMLQVPWRLPSVGRADTDYPMHTWPPEAVESKEHLARLDQFFGEAAAAAPDAVFLLTADHGMNHKSRCLDLEKVWAHHGAPIRIAISVERDKYLKHHNGYGGVAWVYCNAPRDIDSVGKVLTSIDGVESVLTRSEAAKRFHLMASRIGDLIVLGDRDTVLGELDAPSEPLPAEYRSHGSLHEMDVPLLIYNAHVQLKPEKFQYNHDLARWLYAS
jgi:phosphonoacetate hydrolase